ncbi:MAG TPA: hypothetical protein VGK67_17105 [Myxococcales bacterium]|jgi:hypothetical protein
MRGRWRLPVAAAALLGLLLACGVRGSPRAPRPDPAVPAPEEPCDAGCCR